MPEMLPMPYMLPLWRPFVYGGQWDSKSPAARCAGSSPALGTSTMKQAPAEGLFLFQSGMGGGGNSRHHKTPNALASVSFAKWA